MLNETFYFLAYRAAEERENSKELVIRAVTQGRGGGN